MDDTLPDRLILEPFVDFDGMTERRFTVVEPFDGLS